MSSTTISDLLVCQVVHERSRDILGLPNLDAMLQERTGASMKTIHAALQRAHNTGLLECHACLLNAWLTEKGCALLADASAAGVPVQKSRGLQGLVALGLLK